LRRRVVMAHALRYENTLVPIHRETLIGRSAQCQVVVESERVSRRHARLTVTPEGLYLEDLDSANGVFVNGSPVVGRCLVKAGDSIVIGDRPLELIAIEDDLENQFEEERATLIGAPAADDEVDDWDAKSFAQANTTKGDSMALLGGVVERLLDAGDIASAERLMNVRLRPVLTEAEAGAVHSQDVEFAFARLVLRLAKTTKRPTWVEFLFDYYRALGRVMPLEAVQEITALLPVIGTFSAEKLGAYLITVNRAPQNPSDRFALQRLEALTKRK
jgi:FHA domain